MKTEIKTKKLYYGFPVVLIGYKDSKWKYNVTTMSSSYSLGNTLTIGLASKSNAVANIKKYGEFTLNIPCQEILNKVEIAGFHSGQNKIGMADITYDLGEKVDAPLLDECLLGIVCRVEHIVEHGDYTNFIATIERRVICDEMLNEDGSLNSRDFNPIYFMGDDKERVYRYFNSDTKKLGENMGCSAEDDSICG